MCNMGMVGDAGHAVKARGAYKEDRSHGGIVRGELSEALHQFILSVPAKTRPALPGE